MQQPKLRLKYIIIEDSFGVCKGIQDRMDDFSDWECCGFAHHVEEAGKMILDHQPALIFLDWALKGGSAYDVLYRIACMTTYHPYIIFNTGYQSENPDIPQEIINNYKIDKYLVKPVWENFRQNLHRYLQEARIKASAVPKLKDLWLTDVFKKRHHIAPDHIVCIQQHFVNPYHKILYLNNGSAIVLKISWPDMRALLKKYNLCFFVTNSRGHIIIKKYILQYQRPFIQLNFFKQKIEVVKDKLAAFEKWLDD